MATTFGTTTQFDQIPHNTTVITAVNETALNTMKDRLDNRVKVTADTVNETLDFSVES